MNRCVLITLFVLGICIGYPIQSYSAEDEWNDILAKARKEGRVVLGTIAGGAEFRNEISSAFRKRFGFDLVLRVLRSAELTTLLERECDAGRTTFDVVASGNSELRSLYPKGCLQAIKPKLVLPEVANLKNWRDGYLKFNDSKREYILQPTEQYYGGGILINTDRTKADELKSAKDLLKPIYRAKIASFDPRRAGPGQAMATYLLTVFGEEYLRDLYLGQKVVLTTDDRQLVDWIVRGVHQMAIGYAPRSVEIFRKQGLPVDVTRVGDAPGYSTGGVTVLKLMKDSPNPNAAIVLINWLASREGQTIISRTVGELSRRIDVSVDDIPHYSKPRPGIKYLDTYDHEFYINKREAITERLLAILGR